MDERVESNYHNSESYSYHTIMEGIYILCIDDLFAGNPSHSPSWFVHSREWVGYPTIWGIRILHRVRRLSACCLDMLLLTNSTHDHPVDFVNNCHKFVFEEIKF